MALDIRVGSALNKGIEPADQAIERSVTININLKGLCLYNNVLHPLGSRLYFEVSLPRRYRPICGVGILAWFKKVNNEPHGYKLGLKFQEMSDADRMALDTFLHRPPHPLRARAKRLLLVDNDQDFRVALKRRLEFSGYKVRTSSDGKKALASSWRTDPPHAIILSLKLPGLSGIEVCRRLKADEASRNIPVLLFTARSRRTDKQLGRAAGADGYLTKPADGKELIAKVEELIHTH